MIVGPTPPRRASLNASHSRFRSAKTSALARPIANVSSVAARSKSNAPIGSGAIGASTRQSTSGGTAIDVVQNAPRSRRPASSLTHATTRGVPSCASSRMGTRPSHAPSTVSRRSIGTMREYGPGRKQDARIAVASGTGSRAVSARREPGSTELCDDNRDRDERVGQQPVAKVSRGCAADDLRHPKGPAASEQAPHVAHAAAEEFSPDGPELGNAADGCGRGNQRAGAGARHGRREQVVLGEPFDRPDVKCGTAGASLERHAKRGARFA